MPVYEYHCHKCDEVFQVKQRISDDKLTTHESCGGELERLISSTSFVLKGGGWYKTDYGAPSVSNSGADSGAGAGSDSGAKSEPTGGGHGCGGACGCG